MISLLPTWYQRDTCTVARELLGKQLVHVLPSGERLTALITEVEAYDGPEDRASHAFRGKTARTAVMFEPGGMWYVYLVYGMHHMLNIVTGKQGYPAAVLIRGVVDVSGPGRLTKQWQIDRHTYNATLATVDTGLYIADTDTIVPESEVLRTSRIGVDYAGVWADKPYRFVWQRRKYVHIHRHV